VVADKICGNVKVKGLNYDSLQGDMRILTEVGKDIIDANQIPDLVPVLAVAACAKNGNTKIINAQRLRIKESDRLDAVCRTLTSLGADITQTDDGLIIKGNGRLKGGECDSFNDHRIVMSLAIASCICSDKVIINNAQAVNKSYPTFFDDFKKLGGKIEIE
jgi:3-phosphoshikimate 1-carboxyvinyltransferase